MTIFKILRRTLALSLVAASAFAAQISPFTAVSGTANATVSTSKMIDVVYLNGIDNQEPDAVLGSRTLFLRYMSPKIGKYDLSEVQFSYLYNPTGGGAADNLELNNFGNITAAARTFADKRLALALKKSSFDEATKSRLWNAFYNFKLNSLYKTQLIKDYAKDPSSSAVIGSVVQKVYANIIEKVLSGHRVVVVSHSQGNLFAEAVYSVMVAQMTAQQRAAVNFVGVASVASTIPKDAAYTSFVQDEAISAYEVLYGAAKARNFDALRLENGVAVEMSNAVGWDETCHNFVDYYMNRFIVPRSDANAEHSVVRRIIAQIDAAIDLSAPVSRSLNASFITATMSWSGSSSDIDLWMYEPGSTEQNKIYYSHKNGVLAFLDIDDTDGFGPEHIYFMEVNSASDMSGTYTLWAQAYYAPNGDIATIDVNFDNNRVYSRTTALANNEKQCVFKLVLAKDGSKYNYTLSQCD